MSARSCACCYKIITTDIKQCSVCKFAAYCKRECQVAHWSTHKKTCTPGSGSVLKLISQLEKPTIDHMLIGTLYLHCHVKLAYRVSKYPVIIFDSFDAIDRLLVSDDMRALVPYLSMVDTVPNIKCDFEQSKDGNVIYTVVGGTRTVGASIPDKFNDIRLRYIMHLYDRTDREEIITYLMPFVQQGIDTFANMTTEDENGNTIPLLVQQVTMRDAVNHTNEIVSKILKE